MTEKTRRIAERPHQIVERVAEFIKDGDLEGIVTMFHPDCRIAMDPKQAPLEGHDGVRAIFGLNPTKVPNPPQENRAHI